MSEHTPLPWTESGHSDFRGADNHLVGMVNPTGGEVSPKRAKIDRALILRAVNNHESLVKALEYARNELDYIAVKHGYVTTETAVVRAREALAKVS